MSRSSRVRRTNSCCRSMLAMIASARFLLVTTCPACPLRRANAESAARSAAAEPVGQVLAEHDGVVVLGVGRGVEQRDIPLPGGVEQWPDGVGRGGQLGEVAAAELRPPRHVVAE